MNSDRVTLEFEGRDLAEVIGKMINFLNMIKGINLGESDGKHEPRGKDRVAGKFTE